MTAYQSPGRLRLQVCAVIVAGLCAQAQAADVAPAKPAYVLSSNQEHWSSQQFALLLQAAGARLALTPDLLSRFTTAYEQQHVLAKAAESAHLADDPRIAARLALAREGILADEELAQLRKDAPVDAASVHAQFDQHPHDLDQYRLSQILVRVSDVVAPPAAQGRTREQALERAQWIRTQLRQGGNFATLARQYSEDEDSRAEGGSLPTAFAKDLKPQARTAAVGLKLGEVSEPVLDADGYHLIRLDEMTPADFEGSHRLIEFNMRDAWSKQQANALYDAAAWTFDADAWTAQRDHAASPQAPSAPPTVSTPAARAELPR